MSNDGETKQPLIPSLLYTQGDENVQAEAEKELKVPDPDEETAQAAIKESTKNFKIRDQTSKVKAGTTKVGRRPPYLTSRGGT